MSVDNPAIAPPLFNADNSVQLSWTRSLSKFLWACKYSNVYFKTKGKYKDWLIQDNMIKTKVYLE